MPVPEERMLIIGTSKLGRFRTTVERRRLILSGFVVARDKEPAPMFALRCNHRHGITVMACSIALGSLSIVVISKPRRAGSTWVYLTSTINDLVQEIPLDHL
jgi:hypothetical protein